MGSINNLSSNYLQSILGSLQNAGVGTSSSTSNSGSTSQVGQSSDNGQLSPFAQMMSELQQLQQSDPSKYQTVTQQIATNLQSAAQTATADGNSTAASQLTQLATDFTSASQSGQLPDIQDLAQAVSGGGHHHHHGHHSGSATDSDSSSTDPSSTSSTSQASSLYGTSTQNDSLNAAAIILNTLSSDGIGSSNS